MSDWDIILSTLDKILLEKVMLIQADVEEGEFRSMAFILVLMEDLSYCTAYCTNQPGERMRPWCFY